MYNFVDCRPGLSFNSSNIRFKRLPDFIEQLLNFIILELFSEIFQILFIFKSV